MSFWKIIVLSIAQWLLLLALKSFYFNGDLLGGATGNLAYFFLTIIVATLVVRRFGVINYLEAILLVFMWVLGNLFLDFIITVNFTGLKLINNWQYWAGTALVGVAVLFFHKKRHLQIRKEQHGQHH